LILGSEDLANQKRNRLATKMEEYDEIGEF